MDTVSVLDFKLPLGSWNPGIGQSFWLVPGFTSKKSSSYHLKSVKLGGKSSFIRFESPNLHVALTWTPWLYDWTYVL